MASPLPPSPPDPPQDTARAARSTAGIKRVEIMKRVCAPIVNRASTRCPGDSSVAPCRGRLGLQLCGLIDQAECERSSENGLKHETNNGSPAMIELLGLE